MNPILDILMNAAGGQGMQQLGRQFGLSEGQTQGALGQLVPALMAGLQRNTSQEGGLDALLGALKGGNHSEYLDNPELLGVETTVADGNAILGHILGSKDVSRAVAGRASEHTGIGTDILKRMLPVVATMVMGGLNRQNSAATVSEPTSGAGGFLTSLLDQNQSGGIGDNVIGLLGRFIGNR